MATINGTSGNDNGIELPALQGTDEDDVIHGLGGDDHLLGGAGNDSLYGDAGNDILEGGFGNDLLVGGAGDDTLDGGAGNNTLSGGDGNDYLYNGAGDDVVDGGPDDDTLFIGTGTNTIYGGAGNDWIGDFYDRLSPRVAAPGQFIDAGTGDDVVQLFDGQNTVNLGAGTDALNLRLAASNNVITGGEGSDTYGFNPRGYPEALVPPLNNMITDFAVGPAGDVIDVVDLINYHLTAYNGGNPFADGHLRVVQNGNDTLVQIDNDGPAGGQDFATLFTLQNVAAGSLTAFNFAGYPPDGSLPTGLTITGTSADDPASALTGTVGSDVIQGLAGNDQLNGGDGHDALDGGDGNDSLDGGLGNDLLEGGAGDDFLADASGVNVFQGGAGNDHLFSYSTLPGQLLDGGAGNDLIELPEGQGSVHGGDGGDTIRIWSSSSTIDGGAGSDTFEFHFASRANVITDFAAGAGGDVIRAFVSFFDQPTDYFANGAMRLVQSGTDTLVEVRDVNPSGIVSGGYSTVATLKNVAASSLTASNFAGNQPYVHDRSATPPVNDFNGDSRSDLMWISDGGNVRDWLGQANGRFAGNVANFNAVVDAAVWHIGVTGDFNGDGRADILWRSGDGTVTQWMGQANGSFAATAAYTPVERQWHLSGTGDFNGDGTIDLLWSRDDGLVRNWLGQKSGGFVTDNSANFDTTVDPAVWHIAGTGDFNDDGRSDILWQSGDGTFTQWLGQANGGFSPVAQFQGSNGWNLEAIGDFDGDGIDDLLMRSSEGKLHLWFGVHTGTFNVSDFNFTADVAPTWHVAAVGDFNGDGVDDITWRSGDGTITTWLGRTNMQFQENSANVFIAVPTDWHLHGSFVHDFMQ